MAGSISRSGGDRKSIGVDSTPKDTGPKKPLLPTEVSQKWDQLIEQLPAKSLRRIDGFELKLLSELLAMADQLAKVTHEDPADHRSAKLFLNVADRIHRMSAAFGLTPSDRKRLSFDVGEEEPDAFTLWMQSRDDRLQR